MKPIYYLTNDRESRQDEYDVDIKFARSGANSGNLIFQRAVLNQLQDVRLLGTGDIDSAEEGSQFVICLANFIRPGTGYLKDWAQALEKRKPASVTLIGVGAQASDFNQKVNLDEGTKHFIDFVAANSASIGVRGKFTEQVLHDLGIKNVDVIGCPSLFLRTNYNFQMPAKAFSDKMRIAIASTPDSKFVENNRDIYAFGYLHNADYIVQSEKWLIQDQVSGRITDGNFYNGGAVNDGFANTMKEWFLQHSKVFFETQEWFDYIKTIQFYIGARFHGSVAAIIHGVPALTLAHDTRTKELCDYFSMPNLNLKDFSSALGLRKLWEMADYGAFNALYPNRYGRYCAFLEKNGLAHNLGDRDGSTIDLSLADKNENKNFSFHLRQTEDPTSDMMLEILRLQNEVINLKRDINRSLGHIRNLITKTQNPS